MFPPRESRSRLTMCVCVIFAACLSIGWNLQAAEPDEASFVKSSKYARPFNNIETQNARKWLLGPTGIFAYGPYGSGFYLTHFREYTRDRNWFVAISVIPNSPAVGLIFPDDVITGANGKTFPQDEDARVHLGRAIVDSESQDGVLILSVNRKGRDIEVPIQLKPIGGYSSTWPLNCPRTDRMVTDACRFLQEEQLPNGYIPADEARIGTSHGGLLLLGTGEPRYLENARRAAYWFADLVTGLEKDGKRLSWGAWSGSYATILMAEYYQMTGDKSILPALETSAKQIGRGQMPSGGWGHGYFDGFKSGYGEMNNCGITCYMALAMAKECGVKVDEVPLRKARAFFGAFGHAVTSQYGDHDLMIGGYDTWNGKVGQSAVANWVDGNLKFADAYALKVARAMDRVEDGHTGCMMNIVWSPVAASLAPAKEYRRAMDQIDWYYALSRGPRGGFYCQPGGDNLQRTGGEYSVVGENMSTGGFGLALIAPRRHLRILGAPKSVFVVDLPKELEAARELHHTNQWDACIAAVDNFLATEEETRPPEITRLANELRDKARYVKASVAGTLDKLEKMMVVKNRKLDLRAYEIKHMLRPLTGVLGTDHPRLKKIQEQMPYEDEMAFVKGKKYYEACEYLKYLRMELWWPYGHFAQKNSRWMVVVPRDEWSVIHDQATAKAAPKYVALSTADKVPAGWQAMTFDDGAWKAKMPSGKKDQYAKGLVRIPFDLKTTDMFALRLASSNRRHAGYPIGTKVYLNGELVLKCNSRLQGKARLLNSTVELLKNGRNVLAIEFPYTNKPLPLNVEAKLLGEVSDFAWTPVPGRDAEFLALKSERRKYHQTYYVAEKDQRTVKELLTFLNQKPSFMPELHYAMQRFETVVPIEDRTAYIQDMLDSPAWGGRFVGLMLVGKGVVEPVRKRMSKEEYEKVLAAFKKLKRNYSPFRIKVESLLTDPHPLVRVMAARAVGGYGDASKATAPTLITLLEDTDSQHWWVRESAYKTLNGMSLDPKTKHTYTSIALRDPSASVRRHPLSETSGNKDPKRRLAAMQAFQDAMINQVFDAPLGMWTSKARMQVAIKLKELGKDAIRPHLPRFFKSLTDDTGPRLDGCSILIAWFGEETIDKVETLLSDANPVLRRNAIGVLVRMATEEGVTPQLKGRIVKCLEASEKDSETSVSRAATKGLKTIARGPAKK